MSNKPTPEPRGFASVSSIYKVCEGLALYKRDTSHWSFDESKRTKPKPKPKARQAKTQADLLAEAMDLIKNLTGQVGR